MSAGVRFLYRAIRTSPGVGNGEQIPAQASARHLYSTIREIKGVIFDMDGTLTLPVLNFLEMRTRLGIPREADILPTVLKMPREERERALTIIVEMEDEGWYSAIALPGLIMLRNVCSLAIVMYKHMLYMYTLY